MTVKCCVCTKTRIDNQWLYRETNAGEPVSHSYCPACLEAALAELTALDQNSGAHTTPHFHQAAGF